MELTFKQIEITDKNTVLRLLKNAAEKINKKNVDHWQYWKNPPIEKIKWIEEGIINNEFFFINDTNNSNIGMVRILSEDILYWGNQNEKAKYVHSLIVKEEFNGKGLGVKILDTIALNAKKKGCKFLRLDSDAKNPKLCSYYENIGFEKVGIKELPLSNYNLYQKALV